MRFALFAVVAGVGLSACSDQYEPEVVGTKSPQYQQDLADCRAVSARIVGQDQPVQTEAMVGAAFGGLFGALEEDGNLVENAATGALVGAGFGALEGMEDQDTIERAAVRSCLIERGYNVQG